MESRGSPSRGDRICEFIVIEQHPKSVGGKNIEDLTFFTEARPHLFIVVSNVTQVLGGLRMVATALRIIRDSAGGSIDYESEK